MKLSRNFRRDTTPRCPLSSGLWSVFFRLRSVRLATTLLMYDGVIPVSTGRLKVAHCCHSVTVPRFLTDGIIRVAYTIILQSAEERRLRRQRVFLQLLQIVNILVREVSFLHATFVSFQILFVTDTQSELIFYTNKTQFVRRETH